MSQANIPNITPLISITRDEAITLIIASIALEELALSHILNAEGEKIQYILGTLPGVTPPVVTFDDILSINASVRATIKAVTKANCKLAEKLETVLENL